MAHLGDLMKRAVLCADKTLEYIKKSQDLLC
jgi:hypothetical protein